MTIQQERDHLAEIRAMLAADKTTIAEKYHQTIDMADEYIKAKTCAVLDVIIDDLDYEIARKKDEP